MKSNPFAHIVPPEDLARIIGAVSDPLVRGKAAGILWWDLAETHLLHAAAMVPYLPDYPAADFPEDSVFAVLLECAIDRNFAHFRSRFVPPSNPSVINKDRLITRKWALPEALKKPDKDS